MHVLARAVHTRAFSSSALASAVPTVFSEELAGPIGCGLGVKVSWHGSYLLYGSGDGDIRVLEPNRARLTVSLTEFAQSLPKQGPADIATVAWESEYTG